MNFLVRFSWCIHLYQNREGDAKRAVIPLNLRSSEQWMRMFEYVVKRFCLLGFAQQIFHSFCHLFFTQFILIIGSYFVLQIGKYWTLKAMYNSNLSQASPCIGNCSLVSKSSGRRFSAIFFPTQKFSITSASSYHCRRVVPLATHYTWKAWFLNPFRAPKC